MLNDFPTSVRIKKAKCETPQTCSIQFEYPLRALPGQFVMVWLPGVNERPMSIAGDDGKNYTLAIAAVGDTTKKMHGLKKGDFIGIRGPYGTHYTWEPKQKIAILAGGYGAAPMYWLASLASKQKCKIDFFFGARSKNLLLFANKIKKLTGVRFFPSTNDGSAGFKGLNVECFQNQMKDGVKYDLVMTIGPELMMKVVSDICYRHHIPAQLSIERYMKCGFGVCGNCCVDDLGVPICKNGPVVWNDFARKIKEFGVYHRDDLGRKQKF